MQIFLIFALLIAIVAVIFALQNTALVTISLFAWDIHTSLAVALLVALGAGVLVAILFSVPGWVKGGMSRASQKKKFSSIEAERNSYEQKVQALTAERDKYLEKLAASEKEISTLEDQLASISALVPENVLTSNAGGAAPAGPSTSAAVTPDSAATEPGGDKPGG
jgi:putative membrane protein